MRFIRNNSRLTAQLTTLTSTSQTFLLNPVAEAAFQDLDNCFTSAPILIQLDPSKQFAVGVDDSLFCLCKEEDFHPAQDQSAAPSAHSSMSLLSFVSGLCLWSPHLTW